MTDCIQIPKDIAKAVCAIMASVEAVKKSQKNSHGGYMFASTDDIYAAVTRKMGEVGLMILPLQTEHEIKRIEKTDKGGQLVISQWLSVTYQMVLATADATWTDKHCVRSVYCQYTGPQTHQSAESYAKKQFLRSLIQLPTGDMDLDAMPQADSEEAQTALITPRKRMSSYAAKRDGKTDALFNQILQEIQSAVNREMLVHIKEIHSAELATMPSPYALQISEHYEDKMQSFGAFKEAAE